MSGIELKPCPFCGNPPNFTADDSYGSCWITCSCDLEPGAQARKSEQEKAATLWNTRSQSERGRRLEEALRGFVAWRDRVLVESGSHYLNCEKEPWGNGDDGWDDLDALAEAARSALNDGASNG